MENDITLDDLAERHPDVARDIEDTDFEEDAEDNTNASVDAEAAERRQRFWGTCGRVARDITIGLIVFILSVWLGPYVLALTAS